MTAEQTERVSFREVLGVREYRALWLAQLVSIAGDQFARLAVAVLVYQRTGSSLLAAVAFAVTIIPAFAGGLLLGWVADAYPRRAVMITFDLACCALVLVMTLPGLSLWSLLVLLAFVSLALEPFIAARMATNREVLGEKRFQQGTAITISTYQVAQLAGYALGGVVAGTVGPRPALFIDAASFALSALLIRTGVARRPAAGGSRQIERPRLTEGWRLVFASPVARTAMGLMWLAAFFNAPEGVAVPLASSLHGGAAVAGLLLASMCAGATVGPLVWTGLVSEPIRMRWTAIAALFACAILIGFVAPQLLWTAMVLLFCSAYWTGYIASANGALFEAIPDASRGTASGLVGAGMVAGQGLAILAAGAIALVITPRLVIAIFGIAGTAAAIPLVISWNKGKGQ